jgi:hypothetical protein
LFLGLVTLLGGVVVPAAAHFGAAAAATSTGRPATPTDITVQWPTESPDLDDTSLYITGQACDTCELVASLRPGSHASFPTHWPAANGVSVGGDQWDCNGPSERAAVTASVGTLPSGYPCRQSGEIPDDTTYQISVWAADVGPDRRGVAKASELSSTPAHITFHVPPWLGGLVPDATTWEQLGVHSVRVGGISTTNLLRTRKIKVYLRHGPFVGYGTVLKQLPTGRPLGLLHVRLTAVVTGHAA